jgi:outer membrane lipoprotein-sorting protein
MALILAKWQAATLLVALAASASAQEAKADEIIDRMDAAMAYNECEMKASFQDAKASGATRTLEAEIWYAKSEGTMIAFAAPAREKGKRILMIGDSMWMAVPGITKPVRLSGKEAFMGTSFTNDDIMNFDKADDYESRLISSDGGSWTLELAARKRSLPYQRVVLRVGKDYLPIEQSMYLLSGELSKRIEFSEPKNYGGKTRPSTILVSDAMTKGASTTVRFESIVERRVDRSRLSPDRFMK